MSIELTGEAAFDNVMERLLNERSVSESLRRQRAEAQNLAQVSQNEMRAAKSAQQRAETDLKAVRDNYEALKKMVPAKILDAHYKAIDDIPF